MEEKDGMIWVEENRLYLSEDILYVTIVGVADETLANEIKEAYLKFLDRVTAKMNVCIDLNKAGKGSPEARNIWKEMSEFEKTGKIAFIGLHPVARVLATFVMAISRNKSMKFFSTEKEALTWLKEKK